MKILIAGGTGYLGKLLTDYFSSNPENEIFILSRKQYINYKNVHFLKWDGKSFGYWVEFMEDLDLLINLSGKSVNCRYTKANKSKIYSSRIDSTAILCQAINCLNNPPKCFIQMSSATIYEHALLKINTESNGIIGQDFSMDVCKKWEETFNIFPFKNTKKIIIRSSIVLGDKGGVLPVLKQISKLGFGGRHGKGNQKVSWISEEDFIRSVEFLIHKPSGVYNICSPTPVNNTYFQKLISQKVGPLIRFNIPETLIRFGAKIIGTESELLLKSRNVYPNKLIEKGFQFNHPELDLVL